MELKNLPQYTPVSITFEELTERIVRNTNTLAIMYNGLPVMKAPMLCDKLPEIDVGLLKAKGYSWAVLNENKRDFNYLSYDYWQCHCEHGIKHRAIHHCPNCRLTVDKAVNSLTFIEDKLNQLWRWEFIVGE